MNSRNLLLSAFACLALALVAAGCATPTTGGPTCGAGQMSCNGTCANVQTDNQNCGTCGTTCVMGKSCQAGACKCGAGLLDCGGQCLPSSSSNCGACGRTCSGTQVCSNGTCANSCAAGQMQCSGGACANVMTDSANCGSCGNACQGGSTCTNGSCGCATAGQMYCNNACIDTNTNITHCGGCNRPCTGTCANGVCTATTGTGGRGGSGAAGSGGPAGAGGGGAVGTGGSAAGTTGTGGGVAGTTGTGGARSCAIVPPPGATAADVISDFEEGFGVMIPQGGRTGYWSPYNNAMDPQNQTPTKPPVAMADKITVTPGGTCAGNAFASSATGQDNYVGFGAKFHPNMPLTTSDVGDAYNVSAYDGITFRAKTGGGPTTQPVFVEILTKETQPSTSGGTATVQAIDLYNNRGYFASVTGTMQQFFVPFGAMIPRSLPATGTGGNTCAAAGSGPSCQAPKFNPMNALAIQFSFYGPMDTPGFLTPSPVGSYNLIVDDVAFYKRSALPSGMSDLPALPSSTGVMNMANAFPRNLAPANGCFKAQGSDGRLIAQAYANWKTKFVRPDGSNYRVVRPAAETGSGEDTVSEGIAYAMLISAYMNDKPYFDGFWGYWKAHCAVGSGDTCLMTWRIGGAGGQGSATDSDEDAAFALLIAGKMWGGTYNASAVAMMGAVFNADMSTSAPFVFGGSNYKSGNTTNNPSYYAPAFYRAFATASGNSSWTTVANGVYTQLANANAISSNGLISAWCNQNSPRPRLTPDPRIPPRT